MTTTAARPPCERFDDVHMYAVQALPERERVSIETHLALCDRCREELASLGPLLDSFVAWPRDVVRPPRPLWDRIAARVASERAPPAPTERLEPRARERAHSDPPPAQQRREPPWREPDWKEVAPGIFTKLLATDHERHRVSMLVRLAPGVAYPPHKHAGVEELHLLDGILIVDDRTMHPGDYIYGKAGTADALVWSETGCTCVLITSTLDELR